MQQTRSFGKSCTVGRWRRGSTPTAPATLLIETDTLTKTAVLTKAFTIFKNSLPRNPKAVEYLQSRNINHKQHEAGFINAGYHHELGKELTESLAKHGLLKVKPAGGYTPWAKDCIVFRQCMVLSPAFLTLLWNGKLAAYQTNEFPYFSPSKSSLNTCPIITRSG